MSAFLAGDLGGGVVSYPSLQALSGFGNPGSGSLDFAGASTFGQGVDLNNADTFCNLQIVGCATTNLSGQVRIGVQCADSDVSGQYTDPTSGLAQLPTYFASGGLIWLNSGGILGGTIPGAISQGAGGFGAPAGAVFANSGSPNSGFAMNSGFSVFAGFQRTGRYARAFVVSGDLGYVGPLYAGFVSQLRTTGSGGGMTFSPSSGQVQV